MRPFEGWLHLRHLEGGYSRIHQFCSNVSQAHVLGQRGVGGMDGTDMIAPVSCHCICLAADRSFADRGCFCVSERVQTQKLLLCISNWTALDEAVLDLVINASQICASALDLLARLHTHTHTHTHTRHTHTHTPTHPRPRAPTPTRTRVCTRTDAHAHTLT